MGSRVDGPRFMKPEEFEETMQLMRSCFGGLRNNPDRPLPYWADASDSSRHAVIAVDGNIVSHVVCAPADFTAGPTVVTARGIAGVATHPDHRGNGYMSQLMNFWLEQAAASDIPLLELEGDRQRYLRFGFENAGREFRFRITERSHPLPESHPSIRPVDIELDLSAIAEVHDGERYRVRRDTDRYRRVLDPNRYKTLVYDDRGIEGYVSYRGNEPVSVEEFGGSHHAVSALLGHLCDAQEDLIVYTHPHHPLMGLFYQIAADWRLRSHRKLRITNLYSLLSAYQPLLEERWRQLPTRSSRIETIQLGEDTPVAVKMSANDVQIEQAADEEVTLTLGRAGMTRLLFGVADGMWEAKQTVPLLAQLLPLEYYMWQTETI